MVISGNGRHDAVISDQPKKSNQSNPSKLIYYSRHKGMANTTNQIKTKTNNGSTHKGKSNVKSSKNYSPTIVLFIDEF